MGGYDFTQTEDEPDSLRTARTVVGKCLPGQRVSSGLVCVTRQPARHYPDLALLPKKSLTLAKKPDASGWVSFEESLSNSAKSSRWRLVRFCGVSTTTWTYISPVCL